MLKWYCLIIVCLTMLGCGYTQPEIYESHGIIQPLQGVRIIKVDNERVISLVGDYVIRVYPGQRTLLLAAGHNEKTPVEGTKSPFAKMTIDVEEGMIYYITPEYKFGLNNLFFGAGFQEIKAWKPVLKKKTRIRGYENRPPPPPRLPSADAETSTLDGTPPTSDSATPTPDSATP